MENRESKVTEYPVPANVATRFEFFTGIGWYELKFIVIGLVIGAILFFITGLFSKTIYIDPSELSLEMQIGADEEIITNEEGEIEKKVDAVPMILRVIFLITPGTAIYFLIKREPSSNMSIMYSWRSSIEFKKKQNLYMYKYNSGSEV